MVAIVVKKNQETGLVEILLSGTEDEFENLMKEYARRTNFKPKDMPDDKDQDKLRMHINGMICYSIAYGSMISHIKAPVPKKKDNTISKNETKPKSTQSRKTIFDRARERKETHRNFRSKRR